MIFLNRLILIFFVLLIGCQENTIDPSITGSIQGKITDIQGNGLALVQITTAPVSSVVLTDSIGQFVIAEIPVGEYTITAKLADFGNQSIQISITEEQTTQVALLLDRRVSAQGVILGTLLNAIDSQPIRGASITTNPASTAIVTDDAGQFAIDSLPADDYTISVEKTGYRQDSVQVAVKEARQTMATILLQPIDEIVFNVAYST